MGRELFKDAQTGHECISVKLVYYLVMPLSRVRSKEKDVPTSKEFIMAKVNILRCVQAIESKL